MILPETYPIQMTQKQMRQFLKFYHWVLEQAPFIPSELSDFKYDVAMALNKGCFVHKKLCVTFKISDTETETLCFGCNPERYKELKSKYKKVGITEEEDVEE